ncbi:hypothetical protein EDD11_003006 [Mortierella claussenii]|nr:hypothetical protein EDD11_003006 [Mortierella claussenii]
MLDTDFESLQTAIPELQDLTAAQLRRAIKYDAKSILELHPELDMVRRCRFFSEAEAVDRMLFVDDIDIGGHESNPSDIFEQLLLPFPGTSSQSSDTHLSHGDTEKSLQEDSPDPHWLNQQTVIRPYGYKPTRFFQGFCYVEFASKELSLQMTSKILARNNAVRVMPMKQWRKLESEYLSLRTKGMPV